MQGWRPAMEDAMVCAPVIDGLHEDMSLFAVFDGHGGGQVSAYAAEQIVDQVTKRLADDGSPGTALKQSLFDIEAGLRKLNTPSILGLRNRPSVTYSPMALTKDRCRFDLMGSTAVVALLIRSCVTVVNVGDSRVLKCRGGKCVPLTRDHKPESPRERRRIEAAGGAVVKVGPCYRIDCMLNLSRALGDFRYKDADLAPEDQKVSPVGDVTTVEIDQEDEFLLIACDGLFELMTWDSVCEYVHERIQRMPLAKIAEGLLLECCSPDIHSTGGRGTDNESVIIVKLHDF
jgi:serine/threonine protein phosphatase PrpC